MKVCVDSSEVNEGLSRLDKCLKRELGKPLMQMWGVGEKIQTWYRKGNDPLAVAIGPKESWGNRTPILISRKDPDRVMTPDVEINIPEANGSPNRTVNGCFCVTSHGSFILCHRGNGFTVTGGRISKEKIHQHFKKWLVKSHDSELETSMIPVGPVNSDIADQFSMFTDEVLRLKETLSQKSGGQTTQKWRDTLRFPKRIERIITASSTSREYRHGPIQAVLKRKLLEVLNLKRCRVVLNNQVDLGILQGDKLVSVFEVKTDLGDQLYTGIGQLIVYRHYFGNSETRLFLVVPEDVRKSGSSRVTVGPVLHSELTEAGTPRRF